MSPPPRRSARLASAAKQKPLPDLSFDERDATPPRHGPREHVDTGLSPARPVVSTPKSAAPKPAPEEMHPSLFHPTTGEPSSALRLGFSDIPAKKERPQGGGGLISTPSKIGGLLSSPFTFRFNRDAADDALSTDAQRMLGEIRDQAAKIKADMVAQKEAEAQNTPKTGNRVIAKLKGKSGRFSAAHMAEFSKMDSIEGHASAWRAQQGRFTPLKSSLKTSSSKVNLDATPGAPASAIRPTPSKARFADTPDGRPRKNLKRTSSAAALDVAEVDEEPRSFSSVSLFAKRQPQVEGQQSSVKRHKQRSEDDSSTSRPVSRDGSALPRPVTRGENPTPLKRSQSGLSRLMSPTKSSLAHSASTRTIASGIPASPSKISQLALPKSGSTNAISLPSKATDLKRRIISPNRFNKVKSILRGQKMDMDSPKSAIPQPALQVSQTPAPPRLDKALPPLPMTTPRRKLSKRVEFTPQTAKASAAQDSPSPQKPQRAPLQAIEPPYPGDEDIASKPKAGNSLYPDLSPLKRLLDPRSRENKTRSPGMPGTFTFRSDHTIKFDDVSSKGFGASPGQSSIRQIRDSTVPVTDMPGSFPAPPSPSCHSNKENAAPSPGRLLVGTAHGMPNKKRHRASSDEEDAENEAAARAMKKQKNEHVPEGQALLAPRLMGKTPVGLKRDVSKTPSKTPSRLPGRIPGSVSPTKKGNMLSISRLNMLARPKTRN